MHEIQIGPMTIRYSGVLYLAHIHSSRVHVIQPQSVYQQHIQWIQEQAAHRFILAGGYNRGPDDGLIVFSAVDIDAAKQLLHDEPFIRMGVPFTLEEWRLEAGSTDHVLSEE